MNCLSVTYLHLIEPKHRKLLDKKTINGNKVGWIIVSEAIRRYSDNLSKLPTPSVCEWCFTTFKASTVPCCLVSSSINLRGVLWVSGPVYYTSCRTIHHGKLILNRSQTVTTLKTKRDWFIIPYCWRESKETLERSGCLEQKSVNFYLEDLTFVLTKKKSDIVTTRRGSNESSNPLNNENSRFNERVH